MDFTQLIIPAVVVTLLVQVGKDLLGVVSKRWGALVAQLTLLVISFFVAGVLAFFQWLPANIVQGTLTIFASAMVIYEVFYKALYLDVIKGGGAVPTPPIPDNTDN